MTKQRFAVQQPFVGPSPIRFGMTGEQIENALGKPRETSVNRQDETKWEYDELIVTFGAAGEGVVEVVFLPEANLTVFGIDMFVDQNALSKVLALKEEAFEDYGFIVIPALGITLSGFHDDNEEDKAVGIFEQGRWDGRKEKWVPFSENNS